MLAFSFLLALFSQQNLDQVEGPGFVDLVQEYFVISDKHIHMAHYSKIFSWNLENGSLAQTHSLPFQGHYLGIGFHDSELLVGTYNREKSQFSVSVFGKAQTTVTTGIYYSKMYSLAGNLFVTPAILDGVYLTENPFAFTLAEATIQNGKIQIRKDGLRFGKLGQRNRTLQYNVKSMYFAVAGGDIIGVSALEPKVVTYNRACIQKENLEGTSKETVLPGLELELPEWQDPPKYDWIKGFDPTAMTTKEARARWRCRFSKIRGLSSTTDHIAVCYVTAKFASYEDGQCSGKKIGVAVFRHGESKPISHRWINDGVLVGTYNGGFLLFWPNQRDDGSLHPTIEVWNP